MFDTSLVRPRAVAVPRRLGLLTASISIHSAAVIAAIAMSIATVEFPGQAPRQINIYQPVASFSPPPPLGPGPRRTEQPQATLPPRQERPTQPVVTAPVEVPEETPVLEEPAATSGPTSEGEPTSGPVGEGGTGEGGGDPLGFPGGVGEGPEGGIGTPGGGQPMIPGGEVKPARVLTRVEPRYPQAMIVARIRSAVVTVRCVVDRHGRIRNPEIVRSSYTPFNKSVLDAVEKWTFAPGTLRGHPVDTWFELTVTFEVR